MGQRTYGKGSVQQVLPLSSADGIKITMARYYTPSDTNIDKIGIPPDREVLFPELGEDGEKQYTQLLKDDVISKYVEKHPDMNEAQIAAFASTLKTKYPSIDSGSLRRLVRNEVNRTKGTPLYDLDWDIQLNAALNILETGKGEFEKLVKNTKTLKELQQEAAEKK